LLGIAVIRFERKITGERLRLRLVRMRDLFILRSTFRPDLLADVGGAALESFGSPVSLWRWFRSTFQVLYLIERKSACGHSIMGFIGLYNLDMGRRVFLSTVLFDPRHRRHGYGREAVHLLLDHLEEAGAAKEIYVEVVKNNLPSLKFFQNMGFKMQTTHSDCLLMAKNLDKDHAAHGVKSESSMPVNERPTGKRVKVLQRLLGYKESD
jgi:RimJ/RimL family protein N-acetyltransferase